MCLGCPVLTCCTRVIQGVEALDPFAAMIHNNAHPTVNSKEFDVQTVGGVPKAFEKRYVVSAVCQVWVCSRWLR